MTTIKPETAKKQNILFASPEVSTTKSDTTVDGTDTVDTNGISFSTTTTTTTTSTKKNQITIENEDIVCKDSKVILSNERLKIAFSHVYEKARDDAKKFHFCNYWWACLSFAFTSAITLFTADFHNFGIIPGELSRFIVIALSSISCLAGIGFGITKIWKLNNSDEKQERDTAVKEAIDELKLQAETVSKKKQKWRKKSQGKKTKGTKNEEERLKGTNVTKVTKVKPQGSQVFHVPQALKKKESSMPPKTPKGGNAK